MSVGPALRAGGTKGVDSPKDGEEQPRFLRPQREEASIPDFRGKGRRRRLVKALGARLCLTSLVSRQAGR